MLEVLEALEVRFSHITVFAADLRVTKCTYCCIFYTEAEP